MTQGGDYTPPILPKSHTSGWQCKDKESRMWGNKENNKTARRYTVGDKVTLTKAMSANHFRAANMSVVGVISEIKLAGENTVGSRRSRDRRYGIQFPDRPWISWCAGNEFKRVRV